MNDLPKIDLQKIEEFKKLKSMDARKAIAQYAKEELNITTISPYKPSTVNGILTCLEGELTLLGYDVEIPKIPEVNNKPKVEKKSEDQKSKQPTKQTEKQLESNHIEPDFKPTLSLVGPNQGYCVVPWWINDWINENKSDWKVKSLDFPRQFERDVLKSLIFYIKRDGFVAIRETRNSQFIVIV